MRSIPRSGDGAREGNRPASCGQPKGQNGLYLWASGRKEKDEWGAKGRRQKFWGRRLSCMSYHRYLMNLIGKNENQN